MSLRVLHVVEAMHQGGAESLVVEHVRLAAPDVHSTVVALNRGGPALEAARAAGADVVMLGKGRNRLSGLFALAALLRERRIDVVNGHNPVGAMYATLAARLAGVPVVVRTEHSIHYPGRASRLYPPIEFAITALSDRVIAVCDAVHRSHAPRLRPFASRFVTVCNGIADLAVPPATREATRAALGASPSARVVLHIGSLTRQKSQDVLLRAFERVVRECPDAVLWIAGEGPRREALLAQHAASGLGAHVRFLGPRQDAADLLAACDLYVLSSSREGLSVTLLEAMRASRACIATDIGGNAEAIEHGVTGSIVPGGDAGAMADAIVALLREPKRLAAYGAAGRARWHARFTAEGMVVRTEAVYREALAARTTGRAR